MSVFSSDFGTGFLARAFDVIWATLCFVLVTWLNDVLFRPLFQMPGVNKVHFFSVIVAPF